MLTIAAQSPVHCQGKLVQIQGHEVDHGLHVSAVHFLYQEKGIAWGLGIHLVEQVVAFLPYDC